MTIHGNPHPVKFSDDQVAAIRADILQGAILTEVMGRYGISRSQASRIKHGYSRQVTALAFRAD